MHENKEVPIVVGGTSYWIQHLVFPDRLIGSPQKQPTPQIPVEVKDLVPDGTDPEMLQLFESLPASPPSASVDPVTAYKMHNLLSTIDPVMAARWHWRDTRKVLRSLEIIKDTGRKASAIVAEQASKNPLSKPRLALFSYVEETAKDQNKHRFRTLFFWLYAEPCILERRLYERVDRMIGVGIYCYCSKIPLTSSPPARFAR